MPNDATVNIPKDLIAPVIEAHVQAAVIEALGARDELIRKAVSHILNQKVDSSGNACSYGETFIFKVVRTAIHDAVKQTVMDEMPKFKDQIRAQIVEQLSKKNSPLIKKFIEVVTSGLTSPYSIKVSLSDARDE